MIRASLHPPRCWICGHRLHHGLFGIVLGLALAWEDRRDWRAWLPDVLRRDPGCLTSRALPRRVR